MVNWIAKSRSGLVISLDGKGSVHDTQRTTNAGESSFAKIETSIDNLLLPLGIKPKITITITERNAATVAEVVEWCIRRKLQFYLNFYRENLFSTRESGNAYTEDLIIDSMRKAYRVIEDNLKKGSVNLGQLLDTVLLEAHQFTCGAGYAYMVFDHQGRLAQCPMELYKSKEITDVIDSLSIITNGDIPAITVDEKDGCKECIWRYRCTGGCPVETNRVTGRYDMKSPNCRIYKELLPDVLRLEGLRLIKEQGY